LEGYVICKIKEANYINCETGDIGKLNIFIGLKKRILASNKRIINYYNGIY
jgi:hypothetical protein